MTNTNIMNCHGGQTFLSKKVCGGYPKWEDYWPDHAKVGEEFYERIYVAYRLTVKGFQKLYHVQFPLC